MPDFQSGVKYGAQGAAIGTSIAPGIGTAIGGGIGFLAGLFGGGGNDEEERQKRFQEFLRQLAQDRKRKAREVMTRTSGQVQQATAGAARRAAASGRDAEDAILPAQGNAIRAGTREMTAALEPYDRAKTEAQYSFADRPIEPNTLDYLVEAGGAVGSVFQNNRLIEQIGKMGGGTTATNAGGGTNAGGVTAIGGTINPETLPMPIGDPGMETDVSSGYTPRGQISAHRKRDMSYNPLFDDDYLNSIYGN